MTNLQHHIASLHSSSLSLAERIQAITDLIPGLEDAYPPEYGHFVTHPDYDGLGCLDDLGELWLNCGFECRSEHPSFEVRLTHQSVEDLIFELFIECHFALDEAIRYGPLRYPDVDPNAEKCDAFTLIMSKRHKLMAFAFDEEEYKSLWGDEPPAYTTGQIKPDETDVSTPVATREQVERALRKSKTPTGDVKGQTETTGL